ncbi:hypothetical protein E6H14_07485 [Candidatus Bathyarchaeota archaeon]|nr:MAG: hypothetical protein E6H14_07485 [Candidatus Bathyarchaeota archaeon]
MATETTDIRSNPQEQIAHAAEVVGTGEDRQKVFEAVCFGKKKIKLISEIEKRTGLSHKRVLEEGARLHNGKIVKKTKVNGEMAYEKDDWFSSRLKLILKLAKDPKALEKFPTRSNPRPTTANVINVNFSAPKNMVDAREVKIDDIDSFEKVKAVPLSPKETLLPIGENAFQAGLQKIIQEEGEHNDWGGETDDLFSSRLLFKGQRMSVAFGLKGRGTKGKLVPKKMGKDGDQIQRLFRAPADVFLVQYWGQVDESIVEEMKNMAIARSFLEKKTIYYGIIDGQDTRRIITGYRELFPQDILQDKPVTEPPPPSPPDNGTASEMSSPNHISDQLLEETDRQESEAPTGEKSVQSFVDESIAPQKSRG